MTRLQELLTRCRPWLRWVPAIAAPFILYYGALFLFPIQVSDFKTRVELAWNGVSTVRLAKLNSYSTDHCDRLEPGQVCTCVALIHGLGDQATTWKKILLEPAAAWEQPVRLFALDLPGSGASPAPASAEDYRVRTLAKSVAAALESVKECTRWTVAGNSFGGWVAAWVALEWSHRVNKLVLIGSSGMKSAAGDVAKLLTEPTVESLKDFQSRAYHRPRPLPEHVWRAAVARAKNGNSRAVVAAQIPEDFLDERLAEIKRPAIVFRGASDRVIPAEAHQAMASRLPTAAYREEAGCGHLPQKECPAALMKALNEMIRFGAI